MISRVIRWSNTTNSIIFCLGALTESAKFCLVFSTTHDIMSTYTHFEKQANSIANEILHQATLDSCATQQYTHFRHDPTRDVNIARFNDDPRCIVQPPPPTHLFDYVDNSGFSGTTDPHPFDVPTLPRGFYSYVLKNTGQMDACMKTKK